MRPYETVKDEIEKLESEKKLIEIRIRQLTMELQSVCQHEYWNKGQGFQCVKCGAFNWDI